MPQPLRLRQRKRVRDGEMREIEDLSPLPTCRIGTDKRERLQRQTPAGSTDSSSAGEHPALNTGAHEATLEGKDHKVAQVPWGAHAPIGNSASGPSGTALTGLPRGKGACSWSTRAAGTTGPSRTRQFNAEPAPLPSRRCPRRPFDGKLATGLPADIFLAESVAPDEAKPVLVPRSRPFRFRNPTLRQVRVPQN